MHTQKQRHIHILGICGTFMGGLALLAKAMGFVVTGSDANVYPPMSTQLEKAGITLWQGFDKAHLIPAPDLVVVGNAMTRGVPAVEYMLDKGLAYTSGPQFLADFILKDKHIIAIAGTHGKTSTSTMTAWILSQAGIDTGFLIGGVPLCFEQSARLGSAPYFVIEADEYDSAFFDKRSKFIHYRPRTAVLNNLEFDHADIFDDLAAIQKQFHHLVRIVPQSGQIIAPQNDKHLADTLAMGCWSPLLSTSIAGKAQLNAVPMSDDGSAFLVEYGTERCPVTWSLSGQHNIQNALSAIGAALSVGVTLDKACTALSSFAGIKRRMELLGTPNGIAIYDDFAHHPTAIATTLAGAKQRFKDSKIWAVIEPRSNTMRLGQHKDTLADSTKAADSVIWYEPAGLDWQLSQVIKTCQNCLIMHHTDDIIAHLKAHAVPSDVVIIMSNGGFAGLHQKLICALA